MHSVSIKIHHQPAKNAAIGESQRNRGHELIEPWRASTEIELSLAIGIRHCPYYREENANYLARILFQSSSNRNRREIFWADLHYIIVSSGMRMMCYRRCPRGERNRYEASELRWRRRWGTSAINCCSFMTVTEMYDWKLEYREIESVRIKAGHLFSIDRHSSRSIGETHHQPGASAAWSVSMRNAESTQINRQLDDNGRSARIVLPPEIIRYHRQSLMKCDSGNRLPHSLLST